ncbi:MAG: hypothetical protein M1839_001056 [Geoglossum umbratile]|nr:MAG: hypothetical protein M1839_001056 [Geoglossum umbratile]
MVTLEDISSNDTYAGWKPKKRWFASPTPTEYSGDTIIGSSISRNSSLYPDAVRPTSWRALGKRPVRRFALLDDSPTDSGSFQLVEDCLDGGFSRPATARNSPSHRASLEDIASLSYDASAIYRPKTASNAPAPKFNDSSLSLDGIWSDLEVRATNFPHMAKEDQQPGHFSAIRAMIKRTKKGFLVRMFRKSSSSVETNFRDVSEIHLRPVEHTDLLGFGPMTPIRGLSVVRHTTPNSMGLFEIDGNPITEMGITDQRAQHDLSWSPSLPSPSTDPTIASMNSSGFSEAFTFSPLYIGGSSKRRSLFSESFG